jgi:hypothetical protein
MRHRDDLEREQALDEGIKELQCINKKLAKMTLRKEELTEIIIAALGHDHEGQKSYEYDMWKVEVKTPFVYSLNKKAYEESGFLLPPAFNPIRESVSYSVDKKACEEYIRIAPSEVRDLLVELIDKKAGKASVTIKERC